MNTNKHNNDDKISENGRICKLPHSPDVTTTVLLNHTNKQQLNSRSNNQLGYKSVYVVFPFYIVFTQYKLHHTQS